MNWVDIESTGLDEESGYLLEVGCIITDDSLNVLETLALVVQPEDPAHAWEAANDFVREMHTENGLWDAIRNGDGLPLPQVEQRMLDVVMTYTADEKHPLCGSTIGFDRRWLRLHMPRLEAAFHYRNIDVSTLREVSRRFWPNSALPDKSSKKHRALSDLEASINELKHYLNLWGWTP